MQRVLLTGASGFVGTHVLAKLLQNGYAVNALVRRSGSLHVNSFAAVTPETEKPDNQPRLTEIPGNIADPASLDRAIQNCQAVIHLVGIIAEKGGATFRTVHVAGTRNVVAAAARGKIQQFVHMSALGSRGGSGEGGGAVSQYHRTKWEAEELVRGSGLPFTIFRPSLIHGPDGEFTRMLKAWSLGKAPPKFFMPYFGSGIFGQHNRHRIQPVFVDDVADFFVQALGNPVASGRTFAVGGPQQFTWPEMLHMASRVFRGHPKAAVGIPAWVGKLLAHLPGLPFNRDQVQMSQEDNTADLTDLMRCFPEMKLREFEPTLRSYAHLVP